ncbi:Uncharacterised protein [uncultured archaeon]|nr:Uncharacterised protein [uncultured archaeon]
MGAVHLLSFFSIPFLLMLVSGCLLSSEPNLPSVPLAGLSLQASDIGPEFVLAREGPQPLRGQGAGQQSPDVVNTYYWQFLLPSAEAAPDRPFQALFSVIEYSNSSLARQLVSPGDICPPQHAPPLCARIYALPDMDDGYLFEDFKYAKLEQSASRYYVEHGVMRTGQYVLQFDLISRLSSDAPPPGMRALALEKMRMLSSRFKQRLQAASGSG